ncbi:MAG: HAD-IA family hydrolase [Candidatus Kariarchaeaceae archaeon]|jgi:DNA-binding NarL/FixJ family response regulator
MSNDPIDGIVDIVLDHEIPIDITNILVIGEEDLGSELSRALKDSYSFAVHSSEKLEAITDLMLQMSFGIIAIDYKNTIMNVIELSQLVRKYNPLARILLLAPDLTYRELSDKVNRGNFNAILRFPITKEEILKIIFEQEAKYYISREMTNFISQPPTLSKASFLLLDPTLLFGSELIPLNFVGIVISFNTVPRFSYFFERTLTNDAIILAGYLSSLTAMGANLFEKRESLKEINFGGISVIFRFHGSLQISFLVRNLTEHNSKKAEDRIETLMNEIIPRFDEAFQKYRMNQYEEDQLTRLLEEFDNVDNLELFEYNRVKAKEDRLSTANLTILLLSDNPVKMQHLVQQLSTTPIYETSFKILSATDETTGIEIIKQKIPGMCIIDGSISSIDPLNFAEYAKEISPALQILLLHDHHPTLNHEETMNKAISGFNKDKFDYITIFPSQTSMVQDLLELCWNGFEKHWEILDQSESKEDGVTKADSISVARTVLRKDIASYTEEEKPELTGIIISKNLDILFEHFWSTSIKSGDFNKDMLAGMITSLKLVGAEAFTEYQVIGGLELGDTTLFVKHRSDFTFLYFVDKVNPNTSVLITKELEAVTSVFYEIIHTSGSEIPYDLLSPIFKRIATTTYNEFTNLLREIEEQ